MADSEEEVSYKELNRRVKQMAGAFLYNGICKGDRVLVQLPNKLSFVMVFFALMKIGAIPVMMLPAHREAELEGIIKLAEPSAYVVVERYLGFRYVEMALAMKEKFSCLKNIFVDGKQGNDYQTLSEMDYEDIKFPTVDGYETAVLLLSGGTTGVPTQRSYYIASGSNEYDTRYY